jgi:transposase-like protein
MNKNNESHNVKVINKIHYGVYTIVADIVKNEHLLTIKTKRYEKENSIGSKYPFWINVH